MCSLMEFCEEQLDENGFLVGRENDWIYIDWADMDKTGAPLRRADAVRSMLADHGESECGSWRRKSGIYGEI